MTNLWIEAAELKLDYDVNVDDHLLRQYVLYCQETLLSDVLGEECAEELDSKICDETLMTADDLQVLAAIKPVIGYWVKSKIQVPVSFKTRQAGVY